MAAAQETGYSVTFVARSCPAYTDIFANRARNDIQETLHQLGPDSPYTEPFRVNPHTEGLAPQSVCKPLPNWEFTLGHGYQSSAVTGPWGSLSKVTGVFQRDTPILTQDTTPLLDQDGQQIGNDTIAGATTIELTPEEVAQASTPDQLWAQGGTPDDPVLDQRYPGQYGFGALRCAIDALNGDNVEFIFFPEGVHHVFCYGLYVQPPPTSGTITITKKVHDAPAGDNPSFPFSGDISYDANGFQLRDRESKDFYRAGGSTWTVTEGDVANYRLDGIVCTAVNAADGPGLTTFTVTGPTAQIHLVAGEHAQCVYHNFYVPPPGGLTIRKVTFGGVGTFSYAVTPSPNRGEVHEAEATTTQPGVPVDAAPQLLTLAPGRYVIAEQKPTSPDGHWHLLHANCNGASRSTTKPFPVDIVSGGSVVCTFVNSFVPRGSISIAKITEGGTGTTAFKVAPAGEPPAQYLQTATTMTPGVAADATPNNPADATDHLRLGTYHIVEQTPLSSTGDWALTSVVCNGVAIPFAQGTATIELTRTAPRVHCVFTNSFSATPPVLPNPTPVPPNPTPVPPNPQTPNGAYDIADLIVTKVASAPVVTRGQVIGFRITVKNRGPSPAQRVVLNDQPRGPATVVAVHTTAGSCHQSGRLTICPLGTLKRGASVTIIVRSRVETHGTSFVNRAVVGTSTQEQSLANNVDSAQVTVAGPRRPVVGCASSVRARRGTARIAC
jgi:uncharacterized repeat protein (TIGR01451 family)